jgi:hypothetical protein
VASLSSILLRGELPLVEMRAMRLDGQLYPLADNWCPMDVVETPLVRAAAIMAGRSARLIGDLETAAWIWGALPQLLRPIRLCSDTRARARSAPGSDAVVRELTLTDADIVRLGPYATLTPSRTMHELTRQGRSSREILAALADVVRSWEGHRAR